MLAVRSLLVVCLVSCLSQTLVQGKPFIGTKDTKCGYQSCNKARSDALNVHLVPHSHDDVGWLKTVDQYFYGTKTSIQRADVNAIITSVVKALEENEDRRFIQVETAFFHKWWSNQSQSTQSTVSDLVDNGRLEFTGGAWSMNDEGAVHYQSVIDQFALGLNFLNDTFGECARPKIGWQIDPFGHSSEMASIFAHMGFDGLFFARADWRDKTTRLSTKTAEMIWQGSKTLGSSSNIFTSLLYNHYSAPPGFCFDVLCHDDPIVADYQSTEYNFRVKVDDFKQFIVKQAAHYKTNNIIITMGDDFMYQDAISYYRNMDTLIEGFRVWPQKYRGQDINVFYSTPSCYVKAVNDAVNSQDIELPLETYDFFPYASDYHAYWSGYFSSRPASKRSEKSANNLLQIHKQFAALTQSRDADEFFEMQNAVGIMQHHDAITGTEKQHVADDYARIMDEAFKDSMKKINQHVAKLLSEDKAQPISLNLKQCLLKNETVCVETSSGKFTVVVYNPDGHRVKYPVRLPVNTLDFEIVDPNGENVQYQISDNIAHDPLLKHGNQYELTFIAELNAFGMKVFSVKKLTKGNYAINRDTSRRRFKLGNDVTGFTINTSTHLLDSVMIKNNEVKIRQELLFYRSAQGDNSVFEKRASGAYIFRPNGTSALSFTSAVTDFKTYKGEIYDEAQQVFSSWAKQTIRVYHDAEIGDNVEFEWFVGPIPVDDNEGKEVISRFTSELTTWEDYYTDSNGREMIHRVRDYRPTYNYSKEEPIAGNYCPVTAHIMITDGNVRISVLNDRSQGGASLQSGQLELMVHRRMLHDDAFGVGEALNEEDDKGDGVKVRGRHYLTATTPPSRLTERKLANRISLEPWIFIDNTTDFSKDIKREFAGIRPERSLNERIKLLTLEPTGEKDTLLLRLEAFDESATVDVALDLNDFFTNFDVVSLHETNLAGNVLKSNVERLEWNQYPSKKEKSKIAESKEELEVILKPCEIKTFIARVNYK